MNDLTTSTAGMLTVATLNLQNGKRLDLVPELLAQVPGPIDILFFQEGKGWDQDGQARRFEAEELLRPLGLDRSFLTRSTHGTLHELVFVRSERLRPRRHWTPALPDVFHDQPGWLHVRLNGPPGDGTPCDGPGSERVLAVKSTQWAHWSGDARLDEAQKLTRYADPDVWAIIAGDFNSLWPDCRRKRRWWRPRRARMHREFEPDWSQRPDHKRLHKTLPPGAYPGSVRARLRAWWHGDVSDRRALSVLAKAGFHSAGCLADDMTVTVNAKVDGGQGARIDHIVLSPPLAAAVIPDSYGVGVSAVGDRASDHRLVWVSLTLPPAQQQSGPRRSGRGLPPRLRRVFPRRHIRRRELPAWLGRHGPASAPPLETIRVETIREIADRTRPGESAGRPIGSST